MAIALLKKIILFYKKIVLFNINVTLFEMKNVFFEIKVVFFRQKLYYFRKNCTIFRCSSPHHFLLLPLPLTPFSPFSSNPILINVSLFALHAAPEPQNMETTSSPLLAPPSPGPALSSSPASASAEAEAETEKAAPSSLLSPRAVSSDEEGDGGKECGVALVTVAEGCGGRRR